MKICIALLLIIWLFSLVINSTSGKKMWFEDSNHSIEQLNTAYNKAIKIFSPVFWGSILVVFVIVQILL